jgi:5'-deoxynucleotidase
MKFTTSAFFAYINRLRWIKRWSLMRNAIEEDVATHSWEVATLAHGLGIIHNHLTNVETEKVDVNALVVAALYHDASEVITGDMPTPVKYYSPTLRDAFKEIENTAEQQLLNLLPEPLRAAFKPALIHSDLSTTEQTLLKAADRLSAWLKCGAEIRAGNKEFVHAHASIFIRLQAMNLPAISYFMDVFSKGYEQSLDHLLESEVDKQSDH